MIQAVLFDIYGVLGFNGWQAFKQEYFAHNPELWNELKDLGRRVDAGELSNDELVVAVALAAGVSDRMVESKLDDTVPNQPLLEYIQSLKPTYKLGILSNASREDIATKLLSEQQRLLFDAVVTSYHVGLTKPDPEIYLLLCDKLGVEPESCIYVDDQERYVEVAQKLGMKGIRYTSVEQVTQDIQAVLSQ